MANKPGVKPTEQDFSTCGATIPIYGETKEAAIKGLIQRGFSNQRICEILFPTTDPTRISHMKNNFLWKIERIRQEGGQQ